MAFYNLRFPIKRLECLISIISDSNELIRFCSNVAKKIQLKLIGLHVPRNVVSGVDCNKNKNDYEAV